MCYCGTCVPLTLRVAVGSMSFATFCVTMGSMSDPLWELGVLVTFCALLWDKCISLTFCFAVGSVCYCNSCVCSADFLSVAVGFSCDSVGY